MSDALSIRPSPRLGRNGSSDGSARAAIDAARARARRARPRAAPSSSDEDSRISFCCGGDRLQQPRVDVRQRLGDRLARGALEQRGDLQQLEVADGRVGDVEVGVEAQLAEARADARDVLEQLVAQLAERGVQRLVGAEELLVVLLPLARRARRAPPRRTATAAGARRGPSARRRRARARASRASSPRASRRRISATCAARGVGRQALVQQRVGQRLVGVAARARHPRASAGRGRRRGRTPAPSPLRIVITATPRGPRPRSGSSSRSPASATAAIERANSRGVACGARRT